MKKLVSIILVALMVLSFVPSVGAAYVAYSGTCGDNVTWELDDEGVLTISGIGAMDDYSWSSSDLRAPWSKYRSVIEKVIIRNGVTRIGESAFDGESYSYLTEVTIPDSVKSIGNYGFYACSFISDVYYEGTEDEWKDISVYSGNTTLKKANIHYNSSMEVGGKCGEEAYWKFFDGVLTIYGKGVMDDYTSIQETSWYSYVSEIKKVVIENGITTVGAYAFSALTQLKEIDFGNTVEYIKDCAFYKCTKLEELNLPQSLKDIKKGGFGYCILLKEVTLPENVVALGAASFGNCIALEKVILSERIFAMGTGAFAYCKSLKEVVIPAEMTVLSKNLFAGCTSLEYVYIHSGIETISEGVFYGCKNLKEVTIPKSVTSIEVDSFYNCKAVLSVVKGSYAETYAKEQGMNYVYFVGTLLSIQVIGDDGEELKDGYTVNWYVQGTDNAVGQGPEISVEDTTKTYECKIDFDEDLALTYYRLNERITVESTDRKVWLKAIPTVALEGVVTDIDGEPLDGVSVRVEQDFSMGVEKTESAATGNDGLYSKDVKLVPTRVTFSKDGYYSKTINVIDYDNIFDREAGSEVVLDKLPDSKIKMSYVVNSLKEDGEDIEQFIYNDIAYFDYLLYNNTEDCEITEYSYEHPYFVIDSGVAKEGDEITLSITDAQNIVTADDITFVLGEAGSAEVTAELLYNGCFKADVFSENETIVIVFDKTGEFIKTYFVQGTKFKSSNLPEGDYTAVFLKKTQYFSKVESLGKLSEIGLKETDYVLKNVTVEKGKINALGDVNVPDFDEELLYCTEYASVVNNSYQAVTGQLIQIDAKYKVKDGYETGGEKLVFELPENISLVSKSVVVNSQVANYETQGNKVTVYTNTNEAKVRFYVTSNVSGEYAITGYIDCKTDQNNIIKPIGTCTLNVTNADISVPERTNKSSVTVSGVAMADSTVTVYDNYKKVGTTTTNGNGNWSLTFNLPNGDYSYYYHTIYATITNPKYAGCVVTKTKVLEYIKTNSVGSGIYITRIDMNSGISGYEECNNVIFDFKKNTSLNLDGRKYYSVLTNDTFTFNIKFNENSKDLKNVILHVLKDNGSVSNHEATYNSITDTWMVKAKFYGDAPVNVNVSFDVPSYNTIEDSVIQNEAMNITGQCRDVIDASLDVLAENGSSYLTYTKSVDSNGKIVYTAQNPVTGKKLWDVKFSNRNYGKAWSDVGTDNFINKLSVPGIYSCYYGIKATDTGFEHILLSGKAAISIEVDYSNILNEQGEDTTIYDLFTTNAEVLPFVKQILGQSNAKYMETVISQLNGQYSDLYSELLALINSKNAYGSYVIEEAEREKLTKELEELRTGSKTYVDETKKIVGEYLNAMLSATLVSSTVEAVLNSEQFDSSDFVSTWNEMEEGMVDGVLQKELIVPDSTEALLGNAKTVLKESDSVIRSLIFKTGSEEAERNFDSYFRFGDKETLLKNKLSLEADIYKANYYVSYLRGIVNTDITNLRLKIRETLGDGVYAHYDNKKFVLPNIGVHRDPFGYVYEAVPSNRLEGVTATVYYKDENGVAVKWDAENYDQINPHITDGLGQYSWMVPTGEWKVVYEKDGYEVMETEWLPVPPPQMDVNVSLTSLLAPTVETVNAYEDKVEIRFSQYMNIDSVNTSAVKIIMNNQAVTGTITPKNAESTLNDENVKYASVFEFICDSEISGNIVVEVADVINYAGTKMDSSYSEESKVYVEPKMISVPESVTMNFNESKFIEIQVLPKEAGANLNLSVLSSSDDIVSVSEENVVTDENGKATILLESSLIGDAFITISIDGTDVEKTIEVFVEAGKAEEALQCEKVKANFESGTVEKGAVVNLFTETDGADIYYTLDGTDPSDEENTSRTLYTEAIKITENTVIMACAVKEGYTASQVAAFNYKVDLKAVVVVAEGYYNTENTLIMAAYSNDNVLVAQKTFKPSGTGYDEVILESDEPISYTKVMEWNSLGKMVPASESVVSH
ncbi:MAG: leucine-rich repeat protein [Clostridia bacterium]